MYVKKGILSISVLSIISFNSFAETKELNWGINLEPLHYFVPAARVFKKNVEKRTDGRVKVNLHIGEYKQEERDHLKDVRNGKYQMGQETVVNLQKVAPVLKIWDLPFLFLDNEQVFTYTDSKYGKLAFNDLSQYGVEPIEYTYSGGFLNMYGDQINSMSDLKNQSFGMEERSDLFEQNFVSEYKVKVEDYGDKGEFSKSEIISSTVDELFTLPLKKRKYLNLTQHRVFARIVFLNKEFLASLSDKDQLVVKDEAKRMAITEREMAVGMTDVFIDTLAKMNTTINIWTVQKRMIERSKLSRVYKTYTKEFGDKAIKFIDRSTSHQSDNKIKVVNKL